MMLESQNVTWPTIGLCLSIIASALGISAAIWRVVLKTVNGHLARFGNNLMEKLDGQTSTLTQRLDGQTRSLGTVMKEEGQHTRQTLRDLLPR